MKRAPSQAEAAPPPHRRGGALSSPSRNGAVANGAHGGDHGDHRQQQQPTKRPPSPDDDEYDDESHHDPSDSSDDGSAMTLDVRSYESLESAIVRVRSFLERSRRLALEEEEEKEEKEDMVGAEQRLAGIIGGKGKKPPPPSDLFVTILTGDGGDNSPGAVLRQVLRRIFHNRDIRFFDKEGEPVSLLVDALSGIHDEHQHHEGGRPRRPNGIKANKEEEEADNDVRQGAKIQTLPPRDGRGDYNGRGEYYNLDEDKNDKSPPRQRPLQWSAQQGGTANNPYRESLIDTILAAAGAGLATGGGTAPPNQQPGDGDRPAGGAPIDVPFHPVASWAMGPLAGLPAARAPDGVGGAQAQLTLTDRSRGDSPPRIARHLPPSPYDYPFDTIADQATGGPAYRRPYDAAAVALCNALAFGARDGDGRLPGRPAARPPAAGPSARARPTSTDGCRGDSPPQIAPHLPPWLSLQTVPGDCDARVDPDIYRPGVGTGRTDIYRPGVGGGGLSRTTATAAALSRLDAAEDDQAGIVVPRAGAESKASHVVDARQQVAAHDLKSRGAIKGEEGEAGEEEALLLQMASRRSVLDEKEHDEAKLRFQADLEAAMIESRRIDAMRRAEDARFGEFEEELVRDALVRSRAEEEAAAREEEELLRRALAESAAEALHMSEDDVVEEAIRRSLSESERTRRKGGMGSKGACAKGDGDEDEDDDEVAAVLDRILKLSIEERELVDEEEQDQIRRALRWSVFESTGKLNDLDEEDG